MAKKSEEVGSKISAKTCVMCGVCCVAFGQQTVFCNVTEDDKTKLGKRFVRLHVIQPSTFDRVALVLDGREAQAAIKTHWTEQKEGPLAGRSFNTCIALTGSLLHKVTCSVYENRPTVCKTAVRPGDKVCRELRALFKRATLDE